MIIIMKPKASQEAIKNVTSQIEKQGLQVHLSEGHEVTIVGVVGDKSRLNGINFEVADGVDKVVAVTESYKLANRKFHPEASVIPVGNTFIGPGSLTIMAGPCAVESREQLLETGHAGKKTGAHFFRGGAFFRGGKKAPGTGGGASVLAISLIGVVSYWREAAVWTLTSTPVSWV